MIPTAVPAGNSHIRVHDYRQPASLFHLFRAVGSSIGLCYSAHQKIKRTKELITSVGETPRLSPEMYSALAEVDVIRSFFLKESKCRARDNLILAVAAVAAVALFCVGMTVAGGMLALGTLAYGVYKKWPLDDREVLKENAKRLYNAINAIRQSNDVETLPSNDVETLPSYDDELKRTLNFYPV